MLIRSLHRSYLSKALLLATALASPILMATPPEGKTQINYNRCDGNYEGWGVHLWKNPGIPIPGVDWQNPMMPTGTNDFGVYWVADLDNFGRSKTVNYIVHKGDTKDQGGKDKKYSGKDHPEIWVLDGNRKIFYSLEDARAARAKKPCK